ncbi:PspC domain-containing protein [Bacillus marinisedimentorum]|uniref:PspC domain-containing protein n=1 Tax=Bacillus marinisedimentorum TaxID=1821260 RepID=UPI0009F6E231|nr:PspC domain-containing protein [Bacillus marinisedimentorum]
MNKSQLKKSSRDRSVNGVCGGISEFFGIPSFGVRLIFILTLPGSLIIYIVLANSLDDSPQSLY